MYISFVKKKIPGMKIIDLKHFYGILLLWIITALTSGLNPGCSGNGNGPDGDRTPPSIESVSPPEDAVGVPIDTDILIVFSEKIDSNRISPTTFTINPSVVGTFSFDGDTVRFSPAGSLAWSTSYTVSITTGVTDLAGNHLQNNKTWTFTTADDPATTPPVVVLTDPVNGAINVDPAGLIRVFFSKDMDSSTINSSSFTVSGGINGTVSYSDSVAVFTPNDTLGFNTLYTVTIDTTVADTFGNKLENPYVFSFTTGDDPMIPIAWISVPTDSAIIGDTVTITVAADHPVGVTKVEFYVDGVYQTGSDDLTPPYTFFWDASGEILASEHTIHARAYEAGGKTGYSDTISLFYQWEEIVTDKNNLSWPTDLKRMLARSTDTTIEFRYEFWEPWGPDPVNDTTLDLGIYFDSDQNGSTGRQTVFNDTTFLNGLGADYRAIIGLHGLEAFARWDPASGTSGAWVVLFDPTGFSYLNLPPDTNVLEFGLSWSDFGSPSAMRMVSINIWFLSEQSFLPDWMPDQDSGYVLIRRQNRYLGEGYTVPASRVRGNYQAAAFRTNPF